VIFSLSSSLLLFFVSQKLKGAGRGGRHFFLSTSLPPFFFSRKGNANRGFSCREGGRMASFPYFLLFSPPRKKMGGRRALGFFFSPSLKMARRKIRPFSPFPFFSLGSSNWPPFLPLLPPLTKCRRISRRLPPPFFL